MCLQKNSNLFTWTSLIHLSPLFKITICGFPSSWPSMAIQTEVNALKAPSLLENQVNSLSQALTISNSLMIIDENSDIYVFWLHKCFFPNSFISLAIAKTFSKVFCFSFFQCKTNSLWKIKTVIRSLSQLQRIIWNTYTCWSVSAGAGQGRGHLDPKMLKESGVFLLYGGQQVHEKQSLKIVGLCELSSTQWRPGTWSVLDLPLTFSSSSWFHLLQIWHSIARHRVPKKWFQGRELYRLLWDGLGGRQELQGARELLERLPGCFIPWVPGEARSEGGGTTRQGQGRRVREKSCHCHPVATWGIARAAKPDSSHLGATGRRPTGATQRLSGSFLVCSNDSRHGMSQRKAFLQSLSFAVWVLLVCVEVWGRVWRMNPFLAKEMLTDVPAWLCKDRRRLQTNTAHGFKALSPMEEPAARPPLPTGCHRPGGFCSLRGGYSSHVCV